MTETLLIAPELEVSDAPLEWTVTLARPLVGFPASRRFRVHGLGDALVPFLGLSSLDEPNLSFIVIAPGLLFEDYVVELDESDVEMLGLESADDALVVVLVSRQPGAVPTVNLMGPLVLNQRTGIGSQIVLQDPRYRAAVPVDAKSASAAA